MKFRFIYKPKGKAIVSIASKNKENDISALRKKIVKYALQFEGNPYVMGGTSLTKGTDCSGFTQSVYSVIMALKYHEHQESRQREARVSPCPISSRVI